ncbi:MAG: outer membrane lipoprotein-sorting protein [Pseudomonadota bacterium]
MRFSTGVFIGLILTVALCRADTETSVPDAAGIIADADRARGNIDGVVWTADIESTEEGRVSERSLVIYTRGVNALAQSISPAKFKGQMLLMLDRNMWFVKPGLQKPVPISPRQKLMGGAANGDIASTNYAEDYRAGFAGEEPVAGQPCYLFDLRAVNQKVTYDRIRYWISKDQRLGLQAEFYTVSGKLLKIARFTYGNRIRVNGMDVPFVSEMTISDAVRKEDVTRMRYRNVTPEKVPDTTFNLNLLVR